MDRFFNTAGPNRIQDHYTVPPLERLDLEEVLMLIAQKKYFSLHAPRQTGKTSCMLALVDYLNKEGKYKALYANVEAAQVARHNIEQGIGGILSMLGASEKLSFRTAIIDEYRNTPNIAYNNALTMAISLLCQYSDKPIILIIDEVDSLIGDVLISVLRQLRAGYANRPHAFPQSIILCGVRDLKDYRINTSSGDTLTTGSCFNIKSESLRLGDFIYEEVMYLLDEHTKETGQVFDAAAKELIWTLTNGQPWLVNDLAYRVAFENKAARDRMVVITEEMVEQAKNQMILDRVTHLDQLVFRLQEERVRRIIEPMLTGEFIEVFNPDDLNYCIDLGLVRKTKNGVEISNPIYKEVIPRELSFRVQFSMETFFDRLWYVDDKKRIDTVKLFKAFQEFYRQNGAIWRRMADYEEAAPQLIMQAFLQRVINGGGQIDREYAFNTYRTDLYVRWTYEADGESHIQKIVIELKVIRNRLEDTLNSGLEQTAGYLDACGTNEGHLFIFDKDMNKPWEDRVKYEVKKYRGKLIHIWMQ